MKKDTLRHRIAPPWRVQSWLHADADFSLERLRGRVVLVEVFQMLCPGCVSHALPQAQRAARQFGGDLAVIGLHSVFEHHAAQGSRAALEAFAHEYRLDFPIAIDAPGERGDRIPQTMRRYDLRGTPTTILLDRAGRLRLQHFGTLDDMALGAAIMALIAEQDAATAAAGTIDADAQSGCDDGVCRVG
jgi:thiol-disulfide isomerase/thioredoxin